MDKATENLTKWVDATRGVIEGLAGAVRELTVELARTNKRVLELEGKVQSLERWRAYATGQK
jgi:hypothetical protein